MKQAEDGRQTLHCTASSTVEDLHGDTMTDECVRDMAVQAKAKAMTIFLNHRYQVPEDVFGKTFDSQVTNRTFDAEGKAVWDMDLDLVLAGTNPRVPATYALIANDEIKLGVSIGANITEWEFKDEKLGWWGGLVIKKVNLLEASIVGIPANQRSWVQNAVAAIKAFDRDLRRQQESSMDADDTNDQAPLTTEAQRAALMAGVAPAAAVTVVANTAPKTAESDPPATPETPAAPEAPAAAAEPEAGSTETPEGTGTPEGDGSAAAESSGEPSAAAQPTETASATEPHTEIHNAQEAGLIEATVTSLEAAIREITAKDAKITSLNGQVVQLTRERDAANLLAEAASELIEKIATTPLGRKTQIRESADEFAQLASKVWGPEIAATLETRT